METRELRYFVAVAEELNFGRAAERLGMAQPPLSRAIRQLEHRLGTTLFERTNRGVSLTGAGEVLLSEGRTALTAVEAAERRTRRVAADRAGIVLATKSGAAAELLAKLLDAYAAEEDAVHVEIMLCALGEQRVVLHDGRADVALLHLPWDTTDGLDFEVLRTEGQVVVLPAGHPLSARAELTMAEATSIPDLPRVRRINDDGVTTPDGPGPIVRDHTQLFQLVALGRASVVMPESAATHLRDDVVTRPVPDAPGVTTVIAWPPESRSPAVAAFVRTATRL